MADVTGRAGSTEIELNNAATEATLKMLLNATLAASRGNKDELNRIASLAARAGLDSESIIQTNKAITETTPRMSTLGKTAWILGSTFGQVSTQLTALWETGKLLASGNAEASSVFGMVAKTLPRPLENLVNGLAGVASWQEKMMQQYQSITKVGVNFGGSLTDLRLAASKTYMTMDQFAKIVADNGATFAKMGGSVDQGARAFVNISNTLNKSEMGTGLKALGYTTQEVNQGLIDYINITGGRTKKELQNTEALAKGATDYLEQLDGLSKLTGESRESLAAKMKEDAANQAWQGYLLTLDEEGRKRANAAKLEAEARGGKGAAQALQAKLMGLPPMTEAAQKFTGTMQNGNQALDELAAGVKDNTKTVDDIKKAGAGFSQGLAKDGQNLKQVGSAMIMAGKDVELYGRALKAANDAQRNGIKSTEDQIEFEKKIAEETKAQKESEAKAAANTKKSLDELGQTLLAAFEPFLKVLLPVVNLLAPMAPIIAGVVTAFGILKAATLARAAFEKTFSTVSRVVTGGGIMGGAGAAGGAAGGAGGGVMGALGAGLRGMAGGLSAFANPMVIAGSVGFGIAIAAIGAGLAGAAWLLGKALPTLAEGFLKFTEIDGEKLGSSAWNIGKLGLALLPFGPMAIWGIPAGIALNMLGDGLTKIASVDPDKLERVAAGMEKVRAATPSIGESVRAGVAGLVSKVVGPSESKETPPGASTQSPVKTEDSLTEVITEMKRLNSISMETLKFIRETAENTKKNIDATRELSGNLFPSP